MNNNMNRGTNSRSGMADTINAERWANFDRNAADILQTLRQAGLSEDEIAITRLQHELGARFDIQNLGATQVSQSSSSNMASANNATSTRFNISAMTDLNRMESVLNELIADVNIETDAVHGQYFLQALKSLLTDTRNKIKANVRT